MGAGPRAFRWLQGFHRISNPWNGDPDAYAVLIMRNRGAVSHGVWRMQLQCDSSQLAEAVGSSKGAEKLITFREMERGVGAVSELPAVITTDSTSNWQVATRHASATRSRHASHWAIWAKSGPDAI